MAAQRKQTTLNSGVKSPLSLSQSQGNLTGPRRLVNDNLITFYNAIQKWNEMYLSGIKILQNIRDEEDADKFQSCCERLGIIVEQKNQQASIMVDCSKKLASLSQLHPGNNPVFRTWCHQDFGNFKMVN